MPVTLRRSDHGLETPRDEPEGWRQHAVCWGLWDKFDLIGSGTGVQAARSAHLCLAHCPVLRDCRKAADAVRPVEVVQAGMTWPLHRTSPPQQPPDPGHGRWCDHLRRTT